MSMILFEQFWQVSPLLLSQLALVEQEDVVQMVCMVACQASE